MEYENYVGGSVSKSYSRMKENKIKGVSLKTWIVFGIWIVISMIIVCPALLFDFSTYAQLFTTAIIIVWWMGYVKFGRNNRVIGRSIIHFKFIIRALRGETEIAKFVQNTDFLNKFLPIKPIYKDGFIEYLDGTWSVMIKVRGTRISGDNLIAHLDGIKHLHDGLYGEIYITIISTTVLKNDNKLVDNLLEKSKHTSSIVKKEHLVDLHNMVSENNKNFKGHEICIIVNLGHHDTFEDADTIRDGFVPGYIDALEDANCIGHVITSREEIYQEYRSKFLPMGEF